MNGPGRDDLKDQQVERALREIGSLWHPLHLGLLPISHYMSTRTV